MKKIIITQKLPYDVANSLKGYHLVYNDKDQQMDRGKLIEEVADADGIISMLSDKIDRELIDNARNLKIIANYAVGYNNIDVAYAKSRGIIVCNTPHVLTETTAELAFALMLSSARRIVEADRFTRAGQFIGWTPNLFWVAICIRKEWGYMVLAGLARLLPGVAKDLIWILYTRAEPANMMLSLFWGQNM